MRTVLPLGVWTSVSAFSMVFWLGACGGPAEVAKPAAPPVQVQWSKSDGEAPSDEAPAGGGDDKVATASPHEIDLDAPREPAPKPEKVAHKPEPKAAPEPAPEPPPEPEPAPAAEPEPALEVEPPPPPPPTTALGKQIRAAVKDKDKDEPAPKPKKRAAAESKPPASAYTGPNPCKTTRFSVPRVKDACENGGRQAAKGVMKEAVSKALAAGASLKCGDCHANQTDYALKKDAVAQLKKWLGP